MIEVTPGIYQLRLPIPGPLGYINTYLVRGDNEYLLVDTGWDTPESFDALKGQLTEIGVNLEDITRVIVTHIHPDHYGLVGKLKQLSPAKIALHRLEKNFIDSRYINMDKLLQQLAEWLQINGVPADELAKLQAASLGMTRFVAATLPDITLYGQETITIGGFYFQVLWTPGHSPGHISLFEPQRKILIAGDHILPTITPNIGLHPQSSRNPLGDYLNSLNTLEQLEVNLVLPGHEQPFSDLKSRIKELIGHHEQRNSEILKTLKARPKTAYQIATGITWMSAANGTNWDKLRPWDKRMAVLETLSHLELMRSQGRVDKFTQEGIQNYTIAR